ncbi:TPA: MerR family transcriptional regulator [Serratia odorifera]|nr:MerR family transcriptional regulator [Serratia odorifera]
MKRGDAMAVYSIGEVAQLCGINPVTLRAWQRRYGLLKPQRSEGGHRQFDDSDVARIRAIISWIALGVPVSQVKALLAGDAPANSQANWALLQQQLMGLLHAPAANALRNRLYELGREYPVNALIDNVLRPLRAQLSAANPLLQSLRALLDGIIVEYAAFCMAAARKKPGQNALLLAWGASADRTELWLEAIVLAKSGMRVDLLPEPLAQPQPQLFKADRYFLRAEGALSAPQRKQLAIWQDHGLDITLIGSSALLTEMEHP